MSGKKPGRINIHGEPYRAVVLFVTARDQLGRPREAKFMYDEESMNIKGGEEFLVVFAKSDTIAARHN